MAEFPYYNTGTITIASGATSAVGTGTLWQRSNVRAGDSLFVDVGTGYLPTVIREVVDTTHLTIPEWNSATVTDVGYIVFKTSVGRILAPNDSVFADVDNMISSLNNAGFPYVLPIAATVPDPSIGDDDQFAIRIHDGSFTAWKKELGVWVLQWDIADFASYVTSATTAATAAAASATAAAGSATAAAGSATAASGSATAAASSATSASGSATAAASSATAASGSATAAAASAAAAADSAATSEEPALALVIALG